MRAILIVCALAMLSGCQTAPATPPQPPRVINMGCDWVKLITTDPADTYKTKVQILAHDKAYLANCPNQPK